MMTSHENKELVTAVASFYACSQTKIHLDGYVQSNSNILCFQASSETQEQLVGANLYKSSDHSQTNSLILDQDWVQKFLCILVHNLLRMKLLGVLKMTLCNQNITVVPSGNHAFYTSSHDIRFSKRN